MKAPVRIAIAVSLVACLLFFLPYLSAKDAVRENIDDAAEQLGDQQLAEGIDATVQDLRSLSTMKYAQLLYQIEQQSSNGSPTFVMVLFGSLLGLAVLCLIFSASKHPVLMILCALSMAGINWLIRGALVNTLRYNYGIASNAYYICAALLAALGIWIFIAKRKLKKQKAQ